MRFSIYMAMAFALLGMNFSSHAQGTQFEIMFSNILYDFGQVEEWDGQPAEFYITNTGEQTLTIKPSKLLAPDLRIDLPSEQIEAGETIKASVYYNPEQTGTFQKKVLFDLGDKEEPIDLYIKGEVLSFPKSGNELPRDQFTANNIVLLVDISSSMKLSYKLPLLKESIKILVDAMRDIDYITVITYASDVEMVVPQTAVINRSQINTAIDSLIASGRSRGAGALQQSYAVLENSFLEGANNQLILATDGIFNDSDFSDKELLRIIEEKADQNMKMSVIGFGSNDDARKFMKKIAKAGSGNFYHIERDGDVRNVLLEEIRQNSAIH